MEPDIKIEFLQFNAGWGCIVTNNSNYTIQNIFLQLQIKDQHMKDELTTQELTCNADYYLKPHSIRNYISCSPQPPQLLENQTWDYNIQNNRSKFTIKNDADNITLTTNNTELPFFKADGNADNIGVT